MTTLKVTYQGKSWVFPSLDSCCDSLLGIEIESSSGSKINLFELMAKVTEDFKDKETN